jgi:hypothetical protein
VPLYFPSGRGCSPPVTELHGQGGLHSEDTVPGWHDPGGLRTGGFRCRLAALVPKPRVNLTRYHGVLAPNHRWRGLVTPARRGKGIKSISNAEVRTSAERHAAMTWAQRLKRVFNIDISWRFAPIHLVEVCSLCGGSVRVIACIEDQDVIDRILTHLRQNEREIPARPLLVPPTRAPPGALPLFAGKDSRPTASH